MKTKFSKKQRRKLFGGIDVHKDKLFWCIVDKTAKVVFKAEIEWWPQDLELLAKWCKERGVKAIAIESTDVLWMGIADAFEKVGIAVRLYHPQRLKSMKGDKSDQSDAYKLALLCMQDALKESFIAKRLQRRMRLLTRHYKTLRCERIKVKNRIYRLLWSEGVRIDRVWKHPFCSSAFIHCLHFLKQWKGDSKQLQHFLQNLSGTTSKKKRLLQQKALIKPLSPQAKVLLTILLERLSINQKETSLVWKELLKIVKRRGWKEAYERLRSIPGVGMWTALCFLAEVGPKPHKHFTTAKQLARWIGLTPADDISAGKKLKRSITTGNKHLKPELVEAAHAAARTKTWLGYKWKQLTKRGLPRKKAAIAIARKIAVIAWVLLTQNTYYIDFHHTNKKPGNFVANHKSRLQSGLITQGSTPEPIHCAYKHEEETEHSSVNYSKKAVSP